MDELLDAIAALVSLVSPEKVQAVAARVRRTEASKAATASSNTNGNLPRSRQDDMDSTLRSNGNTLGAPRGKTGRGEQYA